MCWKRKSETRFYASSVLHTLRNGVDSLKNGGITNIIKNADYVTIISDHYYRAILKTHEWMVDRSSLVMSF